MLMNYIELAEGIPTRMHFTDHYFVERLIYDPTISAKKPIKSLVFWCDEVNGEPAPRSFSIVSDKLARQFSPYLPGELFKSYDFIITKRGTGFLTEYSVESIKRAKS